MTTFEELKEHLSKFEFTDTAPIFARTVIIKFICAKIDELKANTKDVSDE